MRMVYIFFFALAVFLNSIELSLQTDRSRKRNRNPSTSSSARQHIPAQTSDEKRPLPDRSRSPQGRPPSGEILGHALSELGYIRLIPFTNKRLQFEFRRYVFPVELSLQTDRNLNYKRNSGASSASQHSPDQTSDEERSLRGRSRSPQGRPPSGEILGHALSELGYIRLCPSTNPSLQLEFRRYVFPGNIPIRVRAGYNCYVPVPTREHIVLSASNGDVFALLEYSEVLRGMYRTNANHSRVKINMISGKIDNLTSDEARDCPVGKSRPILPHRFIEVVTKNDSLQFKWDNNSECNPTSSSSFRQISPEPTYAEKTPFSGRSRSPMGRPPSSQVLGYALRELGYIRLIPHTNPSLQLEFRKYVFPDGKPIRVRGEGGGYVPVPTREHIVLSASNGDVFALLEYSGILRGLYRTNANHSRVKINMMSSAVENLTLDEVRDCPIGEKNPIFPQTFTKVVTNEDSLQFRLNPNSQEINPLIFLAELSTQAKRNPSSRSPQGRPPSSEVLGYTLRELGYIRLCPRTNPSLQLEFRRYIFPEGKPIRVRAERNRYVPVPTREHIVLSASNGDIFALLEYSGVLRAIYRPDSSHSRVKINIESGAVDNMTSDEVRDCPTGEFYPIFPQTFTKVVTKYDSLQSESNPNSERNPGSSSSARRITKIRFFSGQTN